MIDTNFLVPILKNEKRHNISDSFGHLICPECKVRTKLYKLSDGRRKCKRCGKKFIVKSKKFSRKAQQLADVIMGFCLDFSALKTARLWKYRYKDIKKCLEYINKSEKRFVKRIWEWKNYLAL
jgi:ribosomal protein L37AE/L43A